MPRRSRASLQLPTQTSDDELTTMRARVREGAEDRPGIYRMHSRDGEVVYVGKSKRVRSRLLSYFRCAYPEEKGARILREATQIDWEYTPSEFAALLYELRLIKRLRPRFNVAMKRDARHYAFIKVARSPAPKLLVVRGAGSEDGGVYYGPFIGAQRVGEAVRELSDALGLRDCGLDQKMHFSDQRELFQISPRTPGCIRHEIKKCLGPCVGACTVGEYMERVAMARAFLDGADSGPIERLRVSMEEASERLEFERAGSLRDKLARLEGLREQFGRLRFAVESLSFVYSVPGHAGDDRVYLIRRGRVRAEVAAPTSPGESRALRELTDSVFGTVEPKGSSIPTHEIDELLLLSSWFRRFPDELERTQAMARSENVTGAHARRRSA
jgi:excinuclease ABC subunit C